MPPAKLKERKVRFTKLNRELKKLFPNPKIALHFSNTWELLVAVILSAQCTDIRVNEVTSKLFKKYKTLDGYVNAKKSEFEQDIKPTGFYKNKAKFILASAKKIKDDFGGRVPDTMDELLSLPGVARKTANVVLGNAFAKSEGIAVDTHVRRFALRFDLTDSKIPMKIEQDLMEIVPKDEWNIITYRFIEYGRQICPARKHDCTDHPLTKVYPKAAKNWPKSR